MDAMLDLVWPVACVGFALWGYVIGRASAQERR